VLVNLRAEVLPGNVYLDGPRGGYTEGDVCRKVIFSLESSEKTERYGKIFILEFFM